VWMNSFSTTVESRTSFESIRALPSHGQLSHFHATLFIFLWIITNEIYKRA
jgi:hypothetical protein